MATSKDMEKLHKFLQTNGLTESVKYITKYAENSLMEKLKEKMIEYITDKKNIVLLISVAIALLRTVIPVSGNVLALPTIAIKALLRLCNFVGGEVSKLNITEMIEEQSRIGLEKEAHAAQGALASSMEFLIAIQNGELNKHEIGIIQSHVPKNLGTEFIGKLEDKVRELLQAGTYGEKEEETLRRCNLIVRHIDRYCILSCLRELVISYLVTIFIKNGVPQNITDNYLERREQFKGTREDLLKVMVRPDPEDACVAAFFSQTGRPLLREQIESITESSEITDDPFEIMSAFDPTFTIFRHDPSTKAPFTLTKYVRVMKNVATKFVFQHSEQSRGFAIHIMKHRNYKWKIFGKEGAELQARVSNPKNVCTSFIVTHLSNGNVMFSPTEHPTSFIKMEKAADNARLYVENNGYQSNCQWRLKKA